MRKMRDNEHCHDCEEIIQTIDGGSDPIENYSYGYHICGKKKPRVYVPDVENFETEIKKCDTE